MQHSGIHLGWIWLILFEQWYYDYQWLGLVDDPWSKYEDKGNMIDCRSWCDFLSCTMRISRNVSTGSSPWNVDLSGDILSEGIEDPFGGVGDFWEDWGTRGQSAPPRWWICRIRSGSDLDILPFYQRGWILTGWRFIFNGHEGICIDWNFGGA